MRTWSATILLPLYLSKKSISKFLLPRINTDLNIVISDADNADKTTDRLQNAKIAVNAGYYQSG